MPGIFGFFDYTKEGKGVYPDEPPRGPVVGFLSILGRKFWKIIQINLMYLLFSLPVIFVAIFVSTLLINWMFPGVTVDTLANLIAATGFEPAEGIAIESYAASQLVIIYLIFGMTLMGLSLVVLGPVHAGFTYVLRNYAREEHAFIWMDFKEQFAVNFKQSLGSMFISLVVTALLVFDFAFCFNTLEFGILRTILMTLIVIAFVFWMIIQMYLYPMMITFKLPLKHLYKNSLLFSFFRLPLNVLILIICLALTFVLPIALFLIGSGLSILIGLFYYLFLMFSVNLLLVNFFVYRGIDKYMIQRIKAQDEEKKQAVDWNAEDEEDTDV